MKIAMFSIFATQDVTESVPETMSLKDAEVVLARAIEQDLPPNFKAICSIVDTEDKSAVMSDENTSN